MAVVLDLPESLRAALKDPLGPVETDVTSVLATAGDPLVTVGDIVTYHVLEADRTPNLALVDQRTERSAVDEEVAAAIEGFDRTVEVANPPGTLTDDLLSAIREGLADDATTLVSVDGEEDLAALPVVAAAPQGATVLYGQPGEGMVVVTVDAEATATVRDLLARMDGDHEAAWRALGVEPA